MNTTSRRNRGFTLVELLVVIGIIAVLLAILMPALTAARKQAKNTKCLNNLRQIGMCISSYAALHQGQLPATAWNTTAQPAPYSDGNWPWDTPYDIVDKLMAEGGADMQHLFYCPFQADVVDTPQIWQYANNGLTTGRAGGSNLGIYANGPATSGYYVLDYVLFIDRANFFMNNSGIINNTPYKRGGTMINYPTSTKFLKSKMTDSDGIADDLELACDAVLSANPTTNPAGNNFTVVAGGNPSGFNSTNHVSSSLNMPMGANVLMLDGHVEWRPFTAMQIRAGGSGNNTPATGSAPYFWW